MKRIFIYITAVLMFFCGCSEISEPGEELPVSDTETVSEPQPFPVTVGDYTFNSSPSKVGSLSPALTEMIFELGFGDRLVCRSIYCTYPDQAASVKEAGSSANPDINTIIECAPELLLTQSPIANKDMVRLSEAGITVMNISSPKSYDELFGNYRSLSRIFSGDIEGDELADKVSADLRDALDDARGSCTNIIFIMNITDDGIAAATGDTFAGDFTAHFGKNTAAANTSLIYTYDELIKADPQVILLAHPLKSTDLDYDYSSQLSAFENGHVYVIDASLTERPTARLAGIIRSISETVREDTGGAEFTGGYAEITSDDENDDENVSDDAEDNGYQTADVNDTQ